MINIFNLFMGNKEEQPWFTILVFNLIILEVYYILGRGDWGLRESYDLAGV